MKKIISVIPIAILIILLSLDQDVYAATEYNHLQTFENIVIRGYNGNSFYIIYGNGYQFSSELYSDTRYIIKTFNTIQIGPYGNLQDALNYIASNPDVEVPDNMANSNYYMDSLYIYKGSVSGDLPAGTVFPEPEPDPSWWETLWDTFNDYFTNPIPGGWIKNLINNVFGDDDNENTISDSVSITSPTLTPAPTPIPFSTVVVPKTDPVTGDTYYETNYIYNNPSGTPIVQPYPPTNSPSANSPSGGSEYNPVNGDPYSVPVVSWLTSAKIGDSNYDGLDSIADGMSSVDDIGSEYTDGIGAAQDATSALPSSWLLLIGIAAAIPLLAGIISRFLS